MRLTLLVPCLAISASSVLIASPQYSSLTPFGGSPLRDLTPFDSDGDGDLDVLGVMSSGVGEVIVIENLGGGAYGTPQAITAENFLLPSMRHVDLDLDGTKDLLIMSSQSVYWLPATSATTFGSPILLVSVNGLTGFAVADLDGDGDLDFGASGRVGSISFVSWLANDGAQSFAAGVTLTLAVDTVSQLRAADMDGDGQEDLILTSAFDDRIGWIRSLGGGSFDPLRVVTAAADRPEDLVAADFDGDGLLDLVAVSSDDSEVAYYRNLGNLSFGPQQVLDVNVPQLRTVAAFDLDFDGDVDILAGANGSVRWYENLGFGFFGVAQIIPAAAGASVTVFDADADSDLDILVSAPGVILNEGTLGSVYCASNPNSTMVNSELVVTGTIVASENRITLTATDLPPSVFGFFITSPAAGMVQPGGSEGILCLSGAIGRYNQQSQIQFSGALRRMSLTIDLTQTPTPLGTTAVMAGDTWHFQTWHRDTVSGQPTSNFSDAVEVGFQ